MFNTALVGSLHSSHCLMHPLRPSAARAQALVLLSRNFCVVEAAVSLNINSEVDSETALLPALSGCSPASAIRQRALIDCSESTLALIFSFKAHHMCRLIHPECQDACRQYSHPAADLAEAVEFAGAACATPVLLQSLAGPQQTAVHADQACWTLGSSTACKRVQISICRAGSSLQPSGRHNVALTRLPLHWHSAPGCIAMLGQCAPLIRGDQLGTSSQLPQTESCVARQSPAHGMLPTAQLPLAKGCTPWMVVVPRSCSA